MPFPTPTNEDIERVHTAIITETYAVIIALVAALTNEQWTATLNDLVAFDRVKRKFSNLNGQIAGFVTDNAGLRLAIRNDIRTRLGLPRLSSETGALPGVVGSSSSASNRSGPVPIVMVW